MKSIRVGTGSTQRFSDDGRRIARVVDRGEPVPETFTVTFEDPEDLAPQLSRDCLDVFRAIKAEPATVSSIANRLQRDRASTERDVNGG